MTDFEPNVVVPPEGLDVYLVPDPGQPTGARLDAGLAVAVVGSQGPWVQVLCSNGFSGWVDGRRLTAIGAAPAAPSPATQPVAAGGRDRTTTWVVIAIIVVLLATAAGVASTLGGDDEDTVGTQLEENDDDDETPPEDAEEDEPEPPSGPDLALVALNVPPGWFLSDDGLVAVEQESDLTSETPSGPRVRTAVGDPADSDLVGVVQEALASDLTDFSQPSEDTIAGVDAFAIVLQSGDLTRAFIATHPPGRDAVFFILEAPSDRFEAESDLLGSVPGLDLS